MSSISKRHEDLFFLISEGKVPVIYIPQFREFGILIDGGPTLQKMNYDPFNGIKFPPDLRDEYFDCLEQMGLEVESDNIPHEYLTEEWWLNRGL